MRAFEVDGESVLMARVDDTFYAVSDTCTHAEQSLSLGTLDAEELTVTCPLHGAVFELETGDVLEFPAREALRSYAVTVEGEDVFVEMPEA